MCETGEQITIGISMVKIEDHDAEIAVHELKFTLDTRAFCFHILGKKYHGKISIHLEAIYLLLIQNTLTEKYPILTSS